MQNYSGVTCANAAAIVYFVESRVPRFLSTWKAYFTSALDLYNTSIKGSYFQLFERETSELYMEEEGVSPPAGFMQISLEMSHNCVNTLTKADFNLLSRAIHGDTHRFEPINRFLKVRTLL